MKIFKKFKWFIKNPFRIILYLPYQRLFHWMSDKNYLKMMYYVTIGKKLSFQSPQTFNEKIQWLKLYDRNPIYTDLVDKYEVRRYIAKVIGKEYLIPLIGVWDTFEDIDFSKLPNQFVLKCTHDSGGLVICKDKSKLNIEEARKKINKCLKRNFYYVGREFSYKNIKPRVICEEYMVDDSGLELKDYKFLCFNGQVKCSFVCLNRNSLNGLNVDFYDLDWTPMPFERHYPNSGTLIPKPKNYNEMIHFAEKLSKEIPFVRTDFYESNGQLYFGELTFYPGSGFEEFSPESYDYLLGSWLELPNEKKYL